MNHALSTVLPEVHLSQDHLTTTSINIAAVFGKRHDNVVRDIRDLDVPEQFSFLNFEEREYKNSRGKMQPMYKITRDGFTLLAMGFTGIKAMKWKIDYINAFNALERAVRGGQEGTILGLQDELLDTQRQLLDYKTKQHAVLNPPNARKPMSDADRLDIYRLRQSGMILKDIGAEVGRTYESVSRVMYAIRKGKFAHIKAMYEAEAAHVQ